MAKKHWSQKPPKNAAKFEIDLKTGKSSVTKPKPKKKK